MKKPPVRILYLDDNPIDAKLITNIIENASDELPAIVDCVSTREAYLAVLKRCEHDVILSDHRMPGYSGDEAMLDAHAIRPDVPFIMVTGDVGEERAIETLKRGATDYVLKDGLARLVPSIQRALKDAAAEQERRATAKSLVEAQRMANIGNWEWNVQTGELRWSEQLYAIYRVDPRTFVPTMDVFAGFVHPDDTAMLQARISQVVSTGNPVDFDFRIIAGDGSVRVLHTVGEIRTYSEDGQPLVMAGTNQDITERKQVEEALLQSEARYRYLHESLRDAFVQVSMDGRVIECNNLYCALLGYSIEELQTMTYRDLTPDRWHDFEGRIVREQILPRGYSDLYEKEYRRKDGTIIPVELRTILARDEDGEPRAMWAVIRDISERKRVEEALRRALEKAEEGDRMLAALMNYVPEGITIADATGKIRMVSRAGDAMLGRSNTGKSVDEIVTAWPLYEPDGVTPVAYEDVPLVKALCTGEVIENAQVVQATASGKKLPLLCNAAPLRDTDGTIVGGIVAWRDISSLKEAEAALKESENRFRIMADSTPFIIWVMNERAETEMVNRAFVDFFGVDDFQGSTMTRWIKAVHPDDIDECTTRLQEALSGQNSFEMQLRLRKKEEWRWMLARGVPRFSESGQFLGLVGSVIDITEQKRMEEKFQRSAANLRLMVQGGYRPMMVINHEGLVETVSEAGAALLGYEEGQLVGRPVENLIVPLSRMEAALQLREVQQHAPRPLTATLRVLRKDGSSFWATAEVSVVVAGDGASEKYLAKFERLEVGARETV